MSVPLVTRALTTGLRVLRLTFDQKVMQVDAGRHFDALNPGSYSALEPQLGIGVTTNVIGVTAVSSVCVDLALDADLKGDDGEYYVFSYKVVGADTRQVGIVSGVDTGADRLEVDGHELAENDPIWIDAVSTATMPDPLEEGVTYYASISDGNHIGVMPDPISAIYDLTTSGAGTRVLYAGLSPEGLDRTCLVTFEDPALFDDLLAWLRSSIPKRLWQSAEGDIITRAIARGLVPAYKQLIFWRDQTFISRSKGTYLDQHARDRGTWRQAAETDPPLRSRLRNPQDALTRPVLLDAIADILTAYSVAGTAHMIEMPRDGIHFATMTVRTFAGCTLTPQGDGTVILSAAPPDTFKGSEAVLYERLNISAATGGSNHVGGAYLITKVIDDTSVRYRNASASGVATGASGALNSSGRKASYWGRGECLARPPCMVVILPAGTTAAVEAAIREMLRQRKAGGVAVQIAKET